MICKFCGKQLEDSQYSKNMKYKSCPRCSVISGEEHVYFRYPNSFGYTPKRESSIHPEGPQSYCVIHRSNKYSDIPVNGILCSELG